MRKCIIFGAGYTGKNVYYKLTQIYEVIGFADNNQVLWGQEYNGIPIINPDEIKKNECDVVICSDHHVEIRKQLFAMDIQNIRMIEPWSCMLYEYSFHNSLYPVEFPDMYQPYVKAKKDKMHILFVQQSPCTRTHKIAEMLYNRGVDVSLAYTSVPPEVFSPQSAKLYTRILAFYSIKDIVDYVNKSEYDLVHCSNEPDDLTNYMLLTNKPVVHDTHDLMSLCRNLNRDMMAMEYLANNRSDGCIYLSKYIQQLAVKRFHIDIEKTVLIENRPSNMALPKEKLPKLSRIDHEIHCVYEGGVTSNKEYFRNMEDIWLTLAKKGIHIHFYTQCDPIYCKKLEKLHPYIHYEGHMDPALLLVEMTKYDCGLAIFKDIPQYKMHLETGIPNKIYEYLAAGLPIVTGDINSHREFVEHYGVGAFLDMNQNILLQLNKIVNIQIEDNFIEKNNLTMRAQSDKLLEFYKQTIKRHGEKKAGECK